MLYDVFLSYSRHDSDWAKAFYNRLRRFRIDSRPIRVFFAPAAISPGASIPRALAEALDDCRHLLVIVTPDWLQSEWCRLEEDVGIWRSPRAEGRLLLPLLLSDCALPPSLSRLRYIDFRDPAAYEERLREVVSAIRRGVQRTAVEYAAERQRRAVLNSPILPWHGFGGPSFDFVWPEMIIDPLVRTRKHPGPTGRLARWLDQAGDLRHSCVAVVGEAGAGKTTVLRTMLLNSGGTLPEKRVFVHARDLLQMIGELSAQTRLAAEDIVVIVDGLDEAGAANVEQVGHALLALQGPNSVLILASRREFFDSQYDTLYRNLSNLSEILELCTWTLDDITSFTQRYADKIGNPDLPQSVRHILGNVPGAGELLSNPMRLTLLLYLLVTGAPVDAVRLQDSYSLYRAFYEEWIRKEQSRGTGAFDEHNVRRAHTEVARQLYEHKGEPRMLAEAADPDHTGDTSWETLLSDSAFAELLVIDTSDPEESTIVSFRHETIGEFLIAQDIIDAFRQGGTGIDKALRCTVGDDVNGFVRAALLSISRPTVNRYLANLSARYSELLAAQNASASMRLREQLLYYIGRLPLDYCAPILRQAFASETHPLLRRSAALGAVLQGDFDIETEYLDILDTPAEALLNRSVQMVYFGDVQGDLHTFIESGGDWSKTRAAIYRRLNGGSVRDLRLRLWDLRTLRSFYESRDYRPGLSPEELETLTSVSLEDPRSALRTILLQQEHALLMAGLQTEPR